MFLMNAWNNKSIPRERRTTEEGKFQKKSGKLIGGASSQME